MADAIANFSGSIAFVWITVLLIGGWIVGNLRPAPRDRIDPFPFPLLTLVLSIEAIFLSIFILMSQNRAARVSDKRSHLDLQLNLLSEQENTKMLLMLEDIAKAVGPRSKPIPRCRCSSRPPSRRPSAARSIRRPTPAAPVAAAPAERRNLSEKRRGRPPKSLLPGGPEIV